MANYGEKTQITIYTEWCCIFSLRRKNGSRRV